ncbi:MAG: AzlD domain-containing protein [Pseudomonadota bacterium]
MTETSFLVAVGVMTACVFVTRLAGPLLLRWTKPTATQDRFLDGLSVSVIAALAASQLVASDGRYSLAAIVAMLTMLISKSLVWSMLAGTLAAAFMAP